MSSNFVRYLLKVGTHENSYRTFVGNAIYVLVLGLIDPRFKMNVIESPSVNIVDVSDSQVETYRKVIQNIIDSYCPVKTREVGIKMMFVLKDDEPVYHRARLLQLHERKEVNAQINKLIKEGIVRHSVSDYASPIVLVEKKRYKVTLCRLSPSQQKDY